MAGSGRHTVHPWTFAGNCSCIAGIPSIHGHKKNAMRLRASRFHPSAGRRWLRPDDRDYPIALPAAIDREHATASVGNPDATAIPAPRTAFDARRIGNLPLEGCTPAATEVDGAIVVATILAFTGDREALVPIGTGAPATAWTAATMMTTRCNEAAAAAAIDPQSAAVNAPGPATNAACVGQLPDHACVAPVNFTARIGIIAAYAIDGIITVLRARAGKRNERTQQKRNNGHPT